MMVICILLGIITLLLLICLGRGGKYYNKNGEFKAVSAVSSFRYCMNHPALAGIGQYVLPWETGIVSKIVPPLSLGYMCRCLGYHVQTVVNGINFLIDMRKQEKLRAFDYYTQEEKLQNPHLDTTRLLYIPGAPGAPFAIVIAGGGYNSVCMMQEAFPVAQRLYEKGYHVFMLKYRVGDLPGEVSPFDKRERAFGDLRRAMEFIFRNPENWQATLTDYSIWGFSAGARMALAWATNSKYGYAAAGLPKPTLQVPIYTVPENIIPDTHIPATFMAMGTKDSFYGEEGCKICDTFCTALWRNGVPAIFEKFEGIGHGFGLGVGTVAEGWFDRAVDLWKSLEACYADRSNS